MARTCSNCGATMQAEVVHNVSLDVCPKCGGTWLDSDELRQVMNSGSLDQSDLAHLNSSDVTQAAQGTSKMCCPNDGAALEIYHYMYNSPLVIHTCPTCGGLWVASGEIEQMEQWRSTATSPPTGAEAANINAAATLAEFQSQHIATMARTRNIGSFFQLLDRWSPGWVGFV